MWAQPFEGKIMYDISYPELPSEMKQYESMLPKEMTMYVNPNFTRIEQASAMGNTVIINDNKSKTSTMLMDMMGNKMGIRSTEEDLKKRDINAEIKIQETDETKEIAGYKCKKAIVLFNDKDGQEQSFDVYYTPEIEAQQANWTNKSFSNIKGFPLEYSMKQQNLYMRLTAKSIKKEKVGKSLLQIPAEYKIMSPEDFKKQMGAMGDGQ
jgi:GLPGLI family protein